MVNPNNILMSHIDCSQKSSFDKSEHESDGRYRVDCQRNGNFEGNLYFAVSLSLCRSVNQIKIGIIKCPESATGCELPAAVRTETPPWKCTGLELGFFSPSWCGSRITSHARIISVIYYDCSDPAGAVISTNALPAHYFVFSVTRKCVRVTALMHG